MSRFSLDSELERRIEAFAQAAQTSPEEVLRRAFEEYEARHNGDGGHNPEGVESCFDRWDRLGLVGCIDDPNLPTDLSTNSRHMEGFGGD
jgi:hypothetical protein